MMEQMERHHPAEPHWYLPLIGVDPAGAGRGRRSCAARSSVSIGTGSPPTSSRRTRGTSRSTSGTGLRSSRRSRSATCRRSLDGTPSPLERPRGQTAGQDRAHHGGQSSGSGSPSGGGFVTRARRSSSTISMRRLRSVPRPSSAVSASYVEHLDSGIGRLARVGERYGRLDVLVNNAGINGMEDRPEEAQEFYVATDADG